MLYCEMMHKVCAEEGESAFRGHTNVRLETSSERKMPYEHAAAKSGSLEADLRLAL